ncbi:NHL repeat domain containing protein [Acanthamoeba castellanii str. Neff]|uniref:NHL repeat domain containing protein n=1 Tax=Acanthamoeba castellanii (strain ATCC 30010 / Neff) TaxID=1257118 RepID=L8GUP9_ACACF|nr:NHL repeat domain containing protein [Acanthamoeba castellanii str. Neff]ELR16358.1 NHL repeat domain containing protein [Acanthamoeba castellanii str. Neff]
MEEVDQLFEKIKAIATINKEIIQRIRGELSVLSFQARLQDRTQLVVDHTASQRAFVEWWRWDGELVAVRDTFKDKVDYSRCHTFAELELLNEKLVVLAEQYHAFEGDFALAQLRQYLTNYELIQTAVGQVDAQFQANAAQYKDLDRTELVNAATREANVALAKLARLNVHLADVQGRPLFNLVVGTDLEIRGIAATREGNVAVLCRKNKSVAYGACLVTWNSAGQLITEQDLYYRSLLEPAHLFAADWQTGRLLFADEDLGQVMVKTSESNHVVCLTPAPTSTTGHQPSTPSGPLVDPVSMAVGADGMVYVTQSHRMDIAVFDASTGALVRTIARPTPLQPNNELEETEKKKEKTKKKRAAVRGLSGIAVHPVTGNIYAADPDNARVLIFTPEGELEGSFHLGEGHSDPAGLTIDAKGNVFVTEQQHSRVLVFHSDGGAPLVVGGGAEASLQLIRSPVAVAVVGDRVFVANTGRTIHVFSFLH